MTKQELINELEEIIDELQAQYPGDREKRRRLFHKKTKPFEEEMVRYFWDWYEKKMN